MEKCKKKSILKTKEVKFTSSNGGVDCIAKYIVPFESTLTWAKNFAIETKLRKEFHQIGDIKNYGEGLILEIQTRACPKYLDKFNWEKGKKVALAKANIVVCKVVRRYISLYKKYLMRDVELINKLEDFCPYFIDREFKYLNNV